MPFIFRHLILTIVSVCALSIWSARNTWALAPLPDAPADAAEITISDKSAPTQITMPRARQRSAAIKNIPSTTKQAAHAAPSAPGKSSSPPVKQIGERLDQALKASLLPDEDPKAVSSAVPPKVEISTLEGIEPGTSTIADLKRVWGEPVSTQPGGGEVQHTFKTDHFQRIDATLAGEIVISLVVYLQAPLPPDAVAKQLQIDDARPVPVRDEEGHLLGQAFPERGVMFSFAKDRTDAQVAHIVLEPIDPQPFVLRAETVLDRPWASRLADVDYALSLDTGYDHAHWVKAELLLSLGRVEAALKSAGDALHLKPDSNEYRLTLARTLEASGQFDKSLAETRRVLSSKELSPEVKARALCHLGDLIAVSPQHDYKQAMNHHLEAIKLADPLSGDKRPDVRRAAKQVLVDAHLAVANDIAAGQWQQKPKVVPKWFDRANAYTDDLVMNEQADPDLRLSTARRILAACAASGGQIDPTPFAKQAHTIGKQLITTTPDPWQRRRLQWELGWALFHAFEAEHAGGKHDAALNSGELAVLLLERAAKGRELTTVEERMASRFLYRIGAIYAVHKNNHPQAITWYEKAVPLLEESLGQPPYELAQRGESLVSIGVSYWETNDRTAAVRLTQQGTNMMESAVKAGALPQSALAVPYSNLASMHETLGDVKKAQSFATMAARYEAPADDAQRRK